MMRTMSRRLSVGYQWWPNHRMDRTAEQVLFGTRRAVRAGGRSCEALGVTKEKVVCITLAGVGEVIR